MAEGLFIASGVYTAAEMKWINAELADQVLWADARRDSEGLRLQLRRRGSATPIELRYPEPSNA